MEFNRVPAVMLWFTAILVADNLSNVQGRYHFHKGQKKQNPDEQPSLPSPVYSPPPQDSVPSTPAHPAPSVPSDPYPDDPGNTTSDCVFDVTNYGAVGDGCADDTAAFRAAWKAACAVESATLLVPSDRCFKITSTIFSGPCKPGLVFKVSHIFLEFQSLVVRVEVGTLISKPVNATNQVDGTLMPPDGPESWPKADSLRQWLVFYRLDQMTLTGTGTIEGNGQKWWELPCKPHRVPTLSS